MKFMELRKKGLIYLRQSMSLSAGAENVELAKWISPKYDEIRNNKEQLTKTVITHIGNSYYSGLVYEIHYGDIWSFDYQIGKLYDPFQFPVPLDVDSEEIRVLVSNNSATAVIPEITLVGVYERDRFNKIEEKKQPFYR